MIIHLHCTCSGFIQNKKENCKSCLYSLDDHDLSSKQWGAQRSGPLCLAVFLKMLQWVLKVGVLQEILDNRIKITSILSIEGHRGERIDHDKMIFIYLFFWCLAFGANWLQLFVAFFKSVYIFYPPPPFFSAGSSTRQATQKRNVSSTRPWCTATPSSPSSPSSEPWGASRSTSGTLQELWVREEEECYLEGLLVHVLRKGIREQIICGDMISSCL